MDAAISEELENVLVNLQAASSGPPNWDIALEYRKLYSAMGTEKNPIEHKNALRFQTQSFMGYGPGVMLYFSLLEALFYTFLIIGVLSTPAMLSNLKGGGLDIYGGNTVAAIIMRTSLANQRYQEFERVQSDPQIYADIEVSRWIIIASDILSSLTFFFFLIYWKVKSDSIVEKLVSEDALPSYYALIVRKLPKEYDEPTFKQHFQKLGGPVVEVSTVYDYEDFLDRIRNF